MISTRFVKLAFSGLAIGFALSGGHAGPGSRTESPSDAQQGQMAAAAAAKATTALAAQNFRIAVSQAEAAVSFRPRDAAYRMLLAQSYLGAGRFAAAETSFADTLTLSPDDGRAALNLALTEIAQGKRDAALSTLADYREKLAASDYGLAMALAGNADAGTKTLEDAVRAGGADAKTRQNLALVYAMAGNWANARVMAAQDLAPADVDDRLGQWANFVQPTSSYDQVASLLGVRPAADSGQPARLALETTPAIALADAGASKVPTASSPTPAAQFNNPPAAAFETSARSGASTMATSVVSAPVRASAAPAAPAPLIRAAATAARQSIVPRAKPSPAFVAALAQPKTMRGVESGKFVVQLGAFENAAVSHHAWKRISGRYGLRNFDPANSAARVGGANFVRLSVGGFTDRSEAKAVCTRIRSAGGSCFVRGLLGDAPAQWVQRGLPKMIRPVRVAAR